MLEVRTMDALSHTTMHPCNYGKEGRTYHMKIIYEGANALVVARCVPIYIPANRYCFVLIL